MNKTMVIDTKYLETKTSHSRRWKWMEVIITHREIYIRTKSKDKSFMEIPYPDLLAVVPKSQYNREFCLELTSKKSKLYLSSPDMKEILDSLMILKEFVKCNPKNLKEQMALSETNRNFSYLEEKSNTETHIIRPFRSIKQTLMKRESELIGIIEDHYLQLRERLEEITNFYRISFEAQQTRYTNFSDLKYKLTQQKPPEEDEGIFYSNLRSNTVSLLNMWYLSQNRQQDSPPEFSEILQPNNSFERNPGICFPDRLPSIIRQSVHVEQKYQNEFAVQRSKQLWITKWKYNENRMDAISFKVNSSLLLTGISLSSPFKKDKILCLKRLELIIGKHIDGKAEYKHSKHEFVNYTGAPTAKISFDRPVPIKPGVFYTVLAHIVGAHSFRCKGGLETVEENNLTWEFTNSIFNTQTQSNKTCVAAGTLPEIFYIDQV